MSTIRGVVFDLDGTLADTAHLSFNDRTPFVLLRQVRAAKRPGPEVWGLPGHSLPGRLLARGYRVAVITRSPAPYAWTLSWLLGLDHEYLLAARACGDDAAEKIHYLRTEWGLGKRQVVYVGDRPVDRQAASEAGVHFVEAHAINHARPAGLDRVRAPVPVDSWSIPIPVAPESELDAGVLDAAVERLSEGAATDEDYELLLDREYLSHLVVHGADTKLPQDVVLMQASGNPPWTNPTDEQVWSDLVRTGDAGRLVDMEPARLMFRLPDPELDAALAREAAAGAYGIIDDTLRTLDPLIAQRIQLPARPVSEPKRVRRMLRSANEADADLSELLTTTLLDEATKLRIALDVLAHDPGHPSRSTLQRLVLGLLPQHTGPCLLEPAPSPYSMPLWRPGLPAWLLTRQEYDECEELRHAAADLTARWFPLQQPGWSDIRACTRYRGSAWGDGIWSQVKQWNGQRSGRWVYLDFLEFPALVLAGHLRALNVDMVVASPATRFSDQQPARASVRLAARAAEIASLRFSNALKKHPRRGVAVRRKRAGDVAKARVAVLDDQTTTGATLLNCANALEGTGTAEVHLVAWSHSRGQDTWTTPHEIFGCWLAETFPDARTPRLTCFSGY